jgi:hypothetical protein
MKVIKDCISNIMGRFEHEAPVPAHGAPHDEIERTEHIFRRETPRLVYGGPFPRRAPDNYRHEMGYGAPFGGFPKHK